MSVRTTVFRSLHDVGAAAWFGGSLMGAVGVNGAAAAVREPTDRARVAAAGWGKWAPVNAVALGAHLIGGAGLLYDNRQRALHQAGVRANTVSKLVLTGVAVSATAASAVAGARAAQGDGAPVQGATDPAPATPPDVAAAQRRLRYLQWALPVMTGSIIVLGAQQGEQQRAPRVVSGVVRTLAQRSVH